MPNARTIFLIREAAQKVQAQLGSVRPGIKVRCVTAVARRVLLDAPFFYNGRSCNPRAMSLGAGVYEVWLDEEGK